MQLKKITLLTFLSLTLIVTPIFYSYSENKSIKIVGPLGLTRAFKNNVSKNMTAKVILKSGAKGDVTLQNLRNGKVASKSEAKLGNGNTVISFSNLERGNWSLIIKNVDELVSVKLY